MWDRIGIDMGKSFGLGKQSFIVFTLLFVIFYCVFVRADIQDVQVSDVTTRAFSVVLASDEPISYIDIHLFEDEDGETAIDGVSVDVVSEGVVGAHANGIGKIDVTSLSPSRQLYFQVEVQSSSGSAVFPTLPPFREVTTATSARATVDGDASPIINALLAHTMAHPDESSSSQGALYLVDFPGFAYSPLSTFVYSDGGFLSSGEIDLNNLYAISGERTEISDDQVMIITEYRGQTLCPGLIDHIVTRYRYAPVAGEAPRYSTESQAILCDGFDFNCDGLVDSFDVQQVSDRIGSIQGECEFDQEFDVVVDGVIDSLDEQALLDAQSN